MDGKGIRIRVIGDTYPETQLLPGVVAHLNKTGETPVALWVGETHGTTLTVDRPYSVRMGFRPTSAKLEAAEEE